MDKQLLEILEGINKSMENLLKDNTSNKISRVKKEIKQAFKESAEISIKKHTNGDSDISIKGRGLAVLITLAGLEKGILEKLNVPKELWEIIKELTGAKEAGDNE